MILEGLAKRLALSSNCDAHGAACLMLIQGTRCNVICNGPDDLMLVVACHADE